MPETRDPDRNDTSDSAADLRAASLEELGARAERAYAAYWGIPKREVPGRTKAERARFDAASDEFLAASRALERRAEEELRAFVPGLFTALDSGDSRAVLRAVRAFRRLPACCRRFVFAMHAGELFLNGYGAEDVTPIAYTDVAIARRARFWEGRGTK